MKKKLAMIIVSTTLLLNGCGTIDQRIDVIRGTTIFSTVEIYVDKDYTFKNFNKEYTDDGQCIVTIIYDKNVED